MSDVWAVVVLFGLLVVATLMVAPAIVAVVALRRAGEQRRRIDELEARVEAHYRRARDYSYWVESRLAALSEADRRAQATTEGGATSARVIDARVDESGIADPDAATQRKSSEDDSQEHVPRDKAPGDALETAVGPAFAQGEGDVSARPAGREAEAPAHVIAPREETDSLEQRLGVTWLTRLGAGVFILGAAYFFKYAVDSEWLGPSGRVAIGAMVGIVCLAIAEWQRLRAKAIFTQGLSGVGLAVLMFSAYASSAFYQLVPTLYAFALVSLLALAGGALALRHRSQIILVLALLATFANPVLLSTGEDRPLALFSYLLLMTTGACAVSFALGAWTPIFLSVLGTSALFLGWYGRYFDVRAATNSMIPGEIAAAAGRYLDMSTRAVPLAFVALVGAQWFVLGGLRHRRQPASFHGPLMLVVALVGWHGATGLLLYDQHVALLGAMLMLVAPVALAFRQTLLLPTVLCPLAASAVTLGVVLSHPVGDPLVVQGLVGLWGALYVVVLVVFRGAREERMPLERRMLSIGLALLAVVVVSALFLLPRWPFAFALVMLVVSAAASGLASAAKSPWLPLAAALVTLASLLWIALPLDRDAVPLGCVWAASYAVVIAWDLFRRRQDPVPARIATLSVAHAGLVALALQSSPPEATAFRALVALGVGTSLFMFGAMLRRAESRRAMSENALLGQSLGYFAIAIALSFSGATITVLWATMAALVVALGAHRGEAPWTYAGLLLLGLSVTRLLAFDLPLAGEDNVLFIQTLGRKGALDPRPFLNPGSVSLLSVAIASFVSARMLFRGRPPWPRASATLAGLGHLEMLTLVIMDLRRWYVRLPDLPNAPLDRREFDAFYSTVVEARAMQSGGLGMLVTLVLGLYGAALLSLGFATRSLLHRGLGLLALAAAVAKLVAWDVWNLPRIYQIVVLVGTGALLLGGGFLYARFGKRLVSLMKTGGSAGVLALVFFAPATDAVAAEGAGVDRFRHRADIREIDAPGTYAWTPDPELYAASEGARTSGSAWSPFADMRVVDDAGREVPWMAWQPATAPLPIRLRATILNRVTLGDQSERLTLALEDLGLRHSEVWLDVVGSEFFRKVSVEFSDDGTTFGRAEPGAAIYRTTHDSVVSERTFVRYPLTDARRVRLTILPGAGDVRIAGAELRRFERAPDPPTGEIGLRVVRTEARKGSSVFVVAADSHGVPLRSLVLDIADAEFERFVRVSATNFPDHFAPVGAGVVYRVRSHEDVSVPIGLTSKRWYRVEVDNGDSPPLTLRSAKGKYTLEKIVFRTQSAGRHEVYIGGTDVAAPRYDLANILKREGDGPSARSVTLGRLEPNPHFGKPEIAKALPWTERHRGAIGIVVGVVTALLGAWTMVMLRRSGPPVDASEARDNAADEDTKV